MVEDVLVVGRHLGIGDDVLAAAHQGADHLPHRQDDLAQPGGVLAQDEQGALQLLGVVHLPLEQVVLQRLRLRVEVLHQLELAVHHVVEQAVQQERDAVAGHAGTRVPAPDHLVDGEVLVLPDGDQGVAGDEDVDLHGVQPALFEVQPVDGDEQVVVVDVHLRPLVVGEDVLDGQLVQPQFLADQRQVGRRGGAQIEPDRVPRIGHMVGDLLDGEAFPLEDAVPVETRVQH